MMQKNISYKDLGKTNQQNYRSTLRSSSQYLNLHLLRTSLSNYSYSPVSLQSPNLSTLGLVQSKLPADNFQAKRFSTLHTYKPASGQDLANDGHSYTRLKDTLSSLQDKINKAQQILNQTNHKIEPIPKKQSKQIQFDIQASISDLDEISTKNNEYHEKFLNNESKLSVNSKNSTTKTLKLRQTMHQSSKVTMLSNAKTKFLKPSKQYYISSLLQMKNLKSDPRVQQHIKLSFEVISNLSNCQALEHKQMCLYKVNLPYKHKHDKKTLLLDIDDTILNCDDAKNQQINYDFQFQIQGEDGNNFPVFIKLRPYAITFLKNIAKVYQIIAFTGSIENYVKKVIEQIDPDGQIFSYQLYRDSCFEFCAGVYVKDIRIINRRPQNIVLVDNSPYSYLYQLQNGIPILPYQQGPDEELPKLQKYLLSISKQKDLREVNKNTFKLHRYNEFTNVNQMISCLYGVE